MTLTIKIQRGNKTVELCSDASSIDQILEDVERAVALRHDDLGLSADRLKLQQMYDGLEYTVLGPLRRFSEEVIGQIVYMNAADSVKFQRAYDATIKAMNIPYSAVITAVKQVGDDAKESVKEAVERAMALGDIDPARVVLCGVRSKHTGANASFAKLEVCYVDDRRQVMPLALYLSNKV